MSQFDPIAIAESIAKNVADIDAESITWAEFCARNKAAWLEADQGEPCVNGNEAMRRVSAVHRALNSLAMGADDGSAASDQQVPHDAAFVYYAFGDWL